MITFDYSKHKDKTPEETVAQIKSILRELDIKTNEDWMDSDVDGCYSNRVSIEGTTLGTNGKGTSRAYCLASGYAELMERLQTCMFYTFGMSEDVTASSGFIYAPDERKCAVSEALATDSCFYESLYQKYLCFTPVMKENLLKNWLAATSDEDAFITIPFVSMKNKRLEYLPITVIFALHGSNGMCAGNTREEALVQGLAEIFERQVQKRLMLDRITPPTVPDEYLARCPGLFQLKQEIESGGRYRVIVKDCSLGKGYPVVGTIIVDTQNGTFGVKLASHPSFDVALERTFTEAFQGKTLEAFTSFNALGGDGPILHRDNLVNTMKTGQGVFPKELLAARASYAFTPFRDASRMTNREMWVYMSSLLLEEGYDILIRDYSFAGFGSYFILVPGFSELYEADSYKIKEIYTQRKIGKKLDFDDRAYLENLARYIQFKKFSLIENNTNWILQRPFVKPVTGSSMDMDFLLLAILFDLGRYAEAAAQANQLLKLANRQEGPEEEALYRGVAHYIFLLSEYGTERAEEAAHTLETLLGAERARRVTDTFVPGGAVGRILPRFNCWDCACCEAAGICGYPAAAGILKRLKEKYRASGLSQEALLYKTDTDLHGE